MQHQFCVIFYAVFPFHVAGQFNANHILNDRAILLKIADNLDPEETNGLESLALKLDCTPDQVAQIMRGSKPSQNFFTNLAKNKRSITLEDLQNLIEGGALRSKKMTIFPSIIADIDNKRVEFTLESTLAEIASNGKHWLYFLENVANKLPSNKHRLLSWQEIASHYNYSQTEIKNFRMRRSDTESPTEDLFAILSQREHVPTIATLKEKLKQLNRHDVIRDIDEWLQKPKN